MKTDNHFKITEGKGFHLKFANGWAVSVQFGPANYCTNYNEPISDESRVKCGQQGSMTAECAVFNPKGEFVTMPNDDTVQGHMISDDVAKLIARIQRRKP